MKNYLLKISLLLLLFFNSCKESDVINYKDSTESIESNIVSNEDAGKIAILTTIFPISFKKDPSNRSARMMKLHSETSKPKKIKNSLAVKHEQENASFYIYNFEGGGFTIVSGDNRLHPILAYSEDGYLPIDSNFVYPSGLVGWLANTDDLVKRIRRDGIKQSKAIQSAWYNFSIEASIALDETLSFIPPECTYNGQIYTTIESYSPLTLTEWGQGVGFNDALENKSCSAYSNGRPPTGCVATAVAQIMAFHQYPSTFNWSAMPNSGGSTATANLMKDVGEKLDMEYGCDGSGSQTEDADNVLRNDYGYTSATWSSNYNPAFIFTNISQGRPVILKGGRVGKWWIFNVYDDGHAWVCDGADLVTEYMCNKWEDDGDPYTTEYEWLYSGSSMYLHMNWGWAGSPLDGNFSAYNFNPGSNTFNYKIGMVYNIFP